MSEFKLRKAARKQVKLKVGFNGPSGSGKTMSALLFAYGITGDWNKIALIDTENESASLYSHLGDFQTIPLAPPFSPERYIAAFKACEEAEEIEVVIIDTGSHEWSGPGGCIEINEKLAATKFRGNTWSAWSQTTPRHDAYIQTLLQSRCHVINCNRSKVETVQVDGGKVKKLGMKEIQRDGFEYELTLSFNVDRDTHTVEASKDRTEIFEGLDPFVITPEHGKMVREWCEKGVMPERPLTNEEMWIGRIENAKTAEDLTYYKQAIKATEWTEKIKDAYKRVAAKVAPPVAKAEEKKPEPATAEAKPEEFTEKDYLEAIEKAESLDKLSFLKSLWPKKAWTKKVIEAATKRATELNPPTAPEVAPGPVTPEAPTAPVDDEVIDI